VKFTPVVLVSASLLLATSPAFAKGRAGNPAGTTAAQAQAAPAQAAPSPLIAAMQQELDREMAVLGKADPAAYFLSYTLTDTDHAEVQGSNGALLSSNQVQSRWAEANVRVGGYQLDNTHRVGNNGPTGAGGGGEPVSVDDDAAVLRRALWRQTDEQYRAAAEAYIKVKTGKDVEVQTTAQGAPDFSQEQPHVFYGAHASFTLDRKPWEQKARVYTNFFHQSANILNSIVTFSRCAEPVSGDQRRNQAAIRASAVPARAFHSGQGARWDGHRSLLQF